MTSDARQKLGNLHYAITYIIIWANMKTESYEYHRVPAHAMFDVISFPAVLSGIGRHFKFCGYVNSVTVFNCVYCIQNTCMLVFIVDVIVCYVLAPGSYSV